MSRGRVVRRWYESWTGNGKLWCGSSNPAEVVDMSTGRDVEYSTIVTYEYDRREAWDGKLPESGPHDVHNS